MTLHLRVPATQVATRFVALAFVAVSAPAHAATVSRNLSGTFSSGQVDTYGYFGPAGGSLSGVNFTARVSYDPSLFWSDPQYCLPSNGCTAYYRSTTKGALRILFSANGKAAPLEGSTSSITLGNNGQFSSVFFDTANQKAQTITEFSFYYETSVDDPTLSNPSEPAAEGPTNLNLNASSTFETVYGSFHREPGIYFFYDESSPDIADKAPQKAVIGQPLNLVGEPVPDANQTTPWAFSLVPPGGGTPTPVTPVNGYTPTPQNFSVGQTYPFPNYQSTVAYLAQPGDYQVTYTPSVGGSSLSASLSLEGPANVTIDPKEGRVQIYYENNQYYLLPPYLACGLVIGVGGTPCMHFDAARSASASGQFQWVQTLQQDDTFSLGQNGRVVRCSLTPGGGLDNVYPYPSQPPCSERSASCTNDSPSITLQGQTLVKRQFQARMYLMWNPNIFGSIFVPLGYVDWGFDARTEYNSTTMLWSKPHPKPTFSQYSPSAEFPTWSVVVANDNSTGVICK